MHIIRHLALCGLAVTLIGCQTRLAGDYYDPALAKHPFRLHLGNDGTYSFEQMYMNNAPMERGRWWRVQGAVVMLVPDDSTKPQWFASVAKKEAFKQQLRHSTDVRDVLREAP